MTPEPCTEAEGLDDMLDWDNDSFVPQRVTLASIRRDIAAINNLAFENSKVERLRLYEVAKAAKVHTSNNCPGCGKPFTKNSYQQAFCSNKGVGNCKDSFWNRAKPERLERAKHFSASRK